MRPGWGGGKLNALPLLLNPLDAHWSETLVGTCSAAACRRSFGSASPTLPRATRSTSDYLVNRANALCDLAEVLQTGGKSVEATTYLEAALALYEQKGDLVDVERVQERLAAAGVTRS